MTYGQWSYLSFAASANLSVPVSQPIAAMFPQQLPVERQARERFVHPGRQLRAIEIGAHRNAVILVRRVRQTLRRRHKLIKTFRLFLVWRAANDRDAVGDHRRAARRNNVTHRKVLSALCRAARPACPKT